MKYIICGYFIILIRIRGANFNFMWKIHLYRCHFPHRCEIYSINKFILISETKLFIIAFRLSMCMPTQVYFSSCYICLSCCLACWYYFKWQSADFLPWKISKKPFWIRSLLCFHMIQSFSSLSLNFSLFWFSNISHRYPCSAYELGSNFDRPPFPFSEDVNFVLANGIKRKE